MRKPFREKLEEGTILFDGGMGTMLYSKGVYINTCFDELNLTSAHLIKQIHEDFIRAGADVIETNTFGASSYKLKAFGLDQKVQEINEQGARLAREVAGDDIYVAGAIGPMGVAIEPIGRVGFDEARKDFAKRAKALADGGVDLIILETFLDISELEQAILGVKDACDLPLIAQMVIRDGESLTVGTPIRDAVIRVDGFDPDVIGFNCAVGPKEMLDALEVAIAFTQKPLSLMPNAGQGRRVEGRTIFLGSPEYFAEFSKRFVQTGAKILGGCCGTTPEHTKAMRRAINALEPVSKDRSPIREIKPETPVEVQPYSPEERSRLSCRLADGKYVTLCELISPKGVDAERVLKQARRLSHHGVDAINIPDGPRASSRMSALALAILIQRNVNVEVVLHYTCRDRNVIGMQSDLLGAWALDIRNILAVTGDPPKLGSYPDATAVYDVDAIGLTNLLWRLNHGLDLARNPIGNPTGFLVGVGVNPGALNLDEELRRLDYKVEAGAEFIITQPVFDLRVFEAFLRRIEHIHIPLLSGIWPLVSLRNAEFLNHEVPGASVPEDVMRRMRAAKTKEEALSVGTSVAKGMVRQMRPHTQGIQMAVPFGRVDMVLEVMEGIL